MLLFPYVGALSVEYAYVKFIMECAFMKIRRYIFNLTYLKIVLYRIQSYIHIMLLFKNYKNIFTDFLRICYILGLTFLSNRTYSYLETALGHILS
jgi:hypothetical protein